jgi:hypothetical protein
MMAQRRSGGRVDDERVARHQEAWERYLEAERVLTRWLMDR